MLAVPFERQIEIIRTHKSAANLSDAAADMLIEQVMENFFNGVRNNRQVRFDLENIVRQAYRSAARAAQDAAREQAGMNKRWAPIPKDLVTDTLRMLLEDVRRNLQEFKDSERDEKDYRKAVLRFRLSATTAAQKGFSDGQLLAFTDLINQGQEARKHWVANLYGNQPCAPCLNLHGMEVHPMEEFPHPPNHKVYGALYGPPLHPNCRCTALYLVVGNGNRDDQLDFEAPEPPRMIKSETIKRMPLGIFRAIIGAVRGALDLLRKAARP